MCLAAVAGRTTPGPGPRLGVVWPLGGIVLTARGEMHGPPLLVGFGLGALLLWRDRRRHPDDRVVAEAGQVPRS